MKNTIIAALALATVWTGTLAFAAVTVSTPPSVSTNLPDTIGNMTGLGNNAGSIAAGRNSAWNPSGNSFIQPPPGGAMGAFGHRR